MRRGAESLSADCEIVIQMDADLSDDPGQIELLLEPILERDYDLVLVHHWWMGQYYHYYLSEPQTVWPLGRDRTGTPAALEDLAKVPAGARVVLVVNDLATGIDPDGSVLAALKATRPLIRERPCLHSALPGTGLVCARIYLFGAAGR